MVRTLPRIKRAARTSVVINHAKRGWEIRLERHGCIIRTRVVSDWHRAERWRALLEREERARTAMR
jgi:hypothetical protein